MESKENNSLENMQVEIKDALTCFICTSKVNDPMMCPKCKRMVCSECIKKWLDAHEKCPFCQAHTTFDEMIALPFMDNITDFFIKEIDKKNEEKEKEKQKEKEKGKNKNINNIMEEEEEEDDIEESSKDDNKKPYLSKTHFLPNQFNNNDEDNQNNDFNKNPRSRIIKKGDFCPEHRNQLIEYFCLDCNTKHCAKCLVFFNAQSKKHEGHKVITIEQKNKYSIDEVKKSVDDLKSSEDELKVFKNNVLSDVSIMEKKEEFVKTVLDEFKKYFTKKIDKHKMKVTAINNQLEKINYIRNNYTEMFKNFVETDDENGFKEYKKKLLSYKDVKKYEYWNNNNIFCKPVLNFYETDFIDIEVNEYNETIGETIINIEGLNRELHLKLNGETEDEVLINILIHLNAFGDENDKNDKDKYQGYLLIINNNNIITISLDEKMIHDDTLILGRTIIKSGLKTIVNQENKIHFKLILSHFNL